MCTCYSIYMWVCIFLSHLLHMKQSPTQNKFSVNVTIIIRLFKYIFLLLFQANKTNWCIYVRLIVTTPSSQSIFIAFVSIPKYTVETPNWLEFIHEVFVLLLIKMNKKNCENKNDIWNSIFSIFAPSLFCLLQRKRNYTKGWTVIQNTCASIFYCFGFSAIAISSL